MIALPEFIASAHTAAVGKLQVNALAGTSWVGGADFDVKLLDALVDEFSQRCQGAVDLRQRPLALARLLAECEEAKK